MTWPEHSQFELTSGELTGHRMADEPGQRALNTPAGHAWVAGAFDRRRVWIRVVTDDFGELHFEPVAREPPRPPDTLYTAWSWDPAAGDWRPTPSLLWRQRQASEPLLSQLAALDAPLARPLTDLLLAVLGGAAVPSEALAKVQAVEEQKAPLRARLAAIAATTSAEDLAGLVANWST